MNVAGTIQVPSAFHTKTLAAAKAVLNDAMFASSPRLTTVESHTQGEPTRILVSGLSALDAEPNAIAVRDKLINEYDAVRKILMLEPRGHRDMFGAILFKPTRPDADLGAVFTDSGGYLNMCGHGSIGVSTFAVESGLVTGGYPSFAAIADDDIDVRLDTPAGLITVTVHVRNHEVENATLTNVPAFVAMDSVTIHVDEPGIPDSVRDVEATISFGGSFFALVDFDSLGLGYDIEASHSQEIADVGMAILRAAREQIDVRHPLVDIRGVDLVEFGQYDEATGHYRNGVVFGGRQVDRSPCGTGTSAKLAALVAHGKMDIGETRVFESITGSKFLGCPASRTTVAGHDAIIPQITGKAFITGVSTFELDSTDIYPEGFLV
ncbi:proline racemase [Bifidobacterium primatium]|uniref:Proline racemase n=2 Tax=Bifidobacterium TaxID=1678 RepID=A0A2M9H9Q0_9BIFI|nr:MULTISPECIES: proline racemase family protein [Bifidobacterium]NEG96730.1 proline racemase [Bifidobacterium sp. SMB2]NEH11886.1 proline racemase [Bifidobacterium saimiriisciurei]PJM73517.1 proline racemase [Bifidobacterium primatium]